ncbi:cysteine dioxygenase [Spongisporangium articulatum]|uniref:Cysteine dioxygenase n=1 Tax=Spongisporangium articulatum TaxID=3362603 RepID=A0ABW8AQX5_9ACTN
MSVTYPALPPVQPLSTPAELGKLATVLASRSDLWGPLLQFDAQNRWFTRFGGGEGWEAWLLTWLPGQRTGLHDHGGSAGAFTVLLGTVREETPHDPVGRTLNAPDLRAFGPEHVHDVVGAGEGPAATLHVYSPTLSVMRRYARTPSGIELTSVEREGSDW